MTALLSMLRFCIRVWFFLQAKYARWVRPRLDRILFGPIRGLRRIAALAVGLVLERFAPSPAVCLRIAGGQMRSDRLTEVVSALWTASDPQRAAARLDLTLECPDYADLADCSALTRLASLRTNLEVVSPPSVARDSAATDQHGSTGTHVDLGSASADEVDAAVREPCVSSLDALALIEQVTKSDCRLTVPPLYRNAGREWLKSLGAEKRICALTAALDQDTVLAICARYSARDGWLVLALEGVTARNRDVIDAIARGHGFPERLGLAAECDLVIGPANHFALVAADAGRPWVDASEFSTASSQSEGLRT